MHSYLQQFLPNSDSANIFFFFLLCLLNKRSLCSVCDWKLVFECGLCLLQGPEGSTLQYMGLSIFNSQEQSVLSSLIPQSLALGFPNILCCEQPFLLTAAVGNGFTSQSIGVALSLHHPQGFSCSGTRRQGYMIRSTAKRTPGQVKRRQTAIQPSGS